jgi:AcrR family transcriptional regulator
LGETNTKRKQAGEEARLPRGPYAISADVVAADQRRRLLEALPAVVAEHSFESATVDQIVKVAQVRRNSFYEQFADKRDCFFAAYEIAQERLFGVLTYQCYAGASLSERVSRSFEAGLNLLGADPAMTRLVIVEAPAAGEGIASRHHEWLDRYGRLLRFAAISSPEIDGPSAAVERAVVGAIVSRVKQVVLAGKAKELPTLRPELVQFVRSFYDPIDAAVFTVAQPRRNDQVEPQPQSSERSPVLEPA